MFVNELKLDDKGHLVTGGPSDVFVKSTKIDIGVFIDDKAFTLSKIPYTCHKWVRANSAARREIQLYENIV